MIYAQKSKSKKRNNMSFFGKIRDHSFFFIVLIIFSFVFNPNTKTILNDEKKYLKKKLYPSIPSSYLDDQIWHKIKEEKHLIQRAKKIGIQFMDKDFWNFLAKKSIYKHITQFKKKEGSFNTKKFKYYLLNIIKNHGFVWLQLQQNINDKILINQYFDMCLCGLNTKKSFIKKYSVDISYLFFPYKKKQKIRDDEIADYMKANSYNLVDMEFLLINFTKRDSEIIKKQKETKYYYSDVSYNTIYYSYNFLPSLTKRGSFYGPSKNYYLLAKITGKKMISDSISASHIFIYHTHKGSRIEELSELFFLLKKKPKLFKALGWIDIGGIKKTSDFQHFLIENPKGQIGVFETPIGYHIIRIDDKSPLRPFYQLSIFLKYISTDQRVKEFIQENGKAFVKNARKKGYQVKVIHDKVFLPSQVGSIIASDISRVRVKNEVKKILKKKKISKELAKNFHKSWEKTNLESKGVGVSFGLPINNISHTINGENGVFLIKVNTHLVS
jgi:peptidyl-prolyl cis-trans isomerase D